jgi:hypothetical protein
MAVSVGRSKMRKEWWEGHADSTTPMRFAGSPSSGRTALPASSCCTIRARDHPRRSGEILEASAPKGVLASSPTNSPPPSGAFRCAFHCACCGRSVQVIDNLVGVAGFEPATPSSRTRCPYAQNRPACSILQIVCRVAGVVSGSEVCKRVTACRPVGRYAGR